MIKTKDWPVVQEARRIAEHQLAYYKQMMQKQNETKETEAEESDDCPWPFPQSGKTQDIQP